MIDILFSCVADDSEEDFHSRLNGLVQSALLSHGVQVRSCSSASEVVGPESADTQTQEHFLSTSSHLADPLTDSLAPSSPPDKSSRAIVVEAEEVCNYWVNLAM